MAPSEQLALYHQTSDLPSVKPMVWHSPTLAPVLVSLTQFIHSSIINLRSVVLLSFHLRSCLVSDFYF
jgi:hypothetical protein